MSRATVQGLALITGVVGFVTALVQCSSAQESQKEATQAVMQAEGAEQTAERLRLELEANQKALADNLAAQQESQRLQEKARLCEEHRLRRVQLDQRFADLQSRHGTLLSSMKSCEQKPEADQGGCIATMCVGAAIFTDGQSNCLKVAIEADAIHKDAKIQGQAAYEDGCDSPLMAVERFMQ